ncbi:hypothetical protein ACFYUV_20905 [Nonomuraea sp. NPDC003560]|uniref:hypothetical protein n=1 Tax=Nonomuraea sp. NPDC003560 TaxID=3364341 RepID=UPI0036CD1544
MKERTMRWIATSVAGVTWGTFIVTATMIQPHIQVYQAVWLATLLVSLVTVVLWFTRPDHGRLAHLRLSGKLQRLEEAIKEEAAGQAGTDKESNTAQARLKSVV